MELQSELVDVVDTNHLLALLSSPSFNITYQGRERGGREREKGAVARGGGIREKKRSKREEKTRQRTLGTGFAEQTEGPNGSREYNHRLILTSQAFTLPHLREKREEKKGKKEKKRSG